MREAVETVSRDLKQVHQNLTQLSELGVTELVNGGHSKHPITQYNDIEVHHSLVTDGTSTE